VRVGKGKEGLVDAMNSDHVVWTGIKC